MTSNDTLHLVTENDLIRPEPELTGLLFECSEDSTLLNDYPNHLMLGELIGDFDGTKRRAHLLARKLLDHEPEIRRIRQLGIFEEIVIRELQQAFHLLHLYRVGIEKDIKVFRFDSASNWSEGLVLVSKILGGSIEVDAPAARRQRSSLIRSFRRLATGYFSLGALKDELWTLMSKVDPYHRRSLVRRWRRSNSKFDQDIWFYSTAYTFSEIGLKYEPWFPEHFKYLIENPLTGGRRLRESNRDFWSIYEFSSSDMVPSRKEVSKSVDQITSHVKQCSLTGDEALVRDMFLNSGWFNEFAHRHLPKGLFSSTIFTRWMEEVQPSALVVGNPGFEGYALHAANREGVPTILLQHGILGDYCQFLNPPVDYYVVRGQFWRDFLSPEAQEKSSILNVPQSNVAATKKPVNNAHKHILFLTVPYEVQLMLSTVERDETLRVLLKSAVKLHKTLLVRVHPTDRVGDYRSVLKRLQAEYSMAADVEYSQGSGLGEAVADAAVAVTYCSTVFLECLRHQVPIVSFGWHDFSYKKLINDYGVFNFAENLEHLGQLIEQACLGELPTKLSLLNHFLAPTSVEKLNLQFAKMTNQEKQ